MSQGGDLLSSIEKELESRCDIIRDPHFDPGPRMNKTDYILAIVISVISLVGTIMGVYA